MSVIKGKVRGNGRQLGRYLLAKSGNEWVRLLDVDGMEQPQGDNLKDLLGAFSQNELLTKSRQGVYHLTINPEPSVAARMTDDDWRQACGIAIDAIGFTGQRKAIVLHCKHGRIHAHVPIERYDHENAKMIPIPHNYRKHDMARAKLEQRFAEQPTPQRNAKRPALRETLTKLWNEKESPLTFLRAAKEQGLIITTGYGRVPYMVVDDTGRSFNLRRHIDGVRIKDLRDGFANTILMGEKEAVAFARQRYQITNRDEKSPMPSGILSEQFAAMAIEMAAPTSEVQTPSTFEESLKGLRRRQQSQTQKPRLR